MIPNIQLERILREDEIRIIRILFQLPKREVFSTIGVYSNRDSKSNGVAPEDLNDHILYNLMMRPGRGFFLEGRCLNQGYLSKERIEQLEREFAEHPHTPEKVSCRYQ